MKKLLTLLCVVGLMSVATADAAFQQKRTIGGLGDGLGALRYPTELTVDGGKLFVADWGNNRISVFSLEGKALSLIQDTERGRLQGPVALQIHKGTLFVLEMTGARLSLFSLDGKFKKAVGGDLGLKNPRDFLIVQDKIYFADTDNNRVVITNLEGKRIGVFAGLQGPRGMDMAFSRLLITNPNASYVSDVNPQTGAPTRKLGADGSLKNPRRLAQGGDFLFVSDYANSRVLVYDKSYKIIESVGNGILKNPEGVFYHPAHKALYVADAENDRIVVFVNVPGASPNPVKITDVPVKVQPNSSDPLKISRQEVLNAMMEKQKAALAFKAANEKAERSALALARAASGTLKPAGQETKEASVQFILKDNQPQVVAVFGNSSTVTLGVISLDAGPIFSEPLDGQHERLRYLDYDKDGLDDLVLDVKNGSDTTRYFFKAGQGGKSLMLSLSLNIKSDKSESRTFFEGQRLFEVRKSKSGEEKVVMYLLENGKFTEEGELK